VRRRRLQEARRSTKGLRFLLKLRRLQPAGIEFTLAWVHVLWARARQNGPGGHDGDFFNVRFKPLYALPPSESGSLAASAAFSTTASSSSVLSSSRWRCLVR
jgi:hypothetical protein